MDNLPDDLLSEILIRLPAKPLHRFKSVSKQWHSLITTPRFTTSYITHHSSSFHVIDRLITLTPHSCPHHLTLVPTPNISHFSINRSLLLSPHETPPQDSSPFDFLILQSSHGLLLFAIEAINDPRRTNPRTPFSSFFIQNSPSNETTLFLGSPLTRHWLRLPTPPHPFNHRFCIALITRVDDGDDHNLGIVTNFVIADYIHLIPNNGAMLMCFSSETGKWVVKQTDYVLGRHAWRPYWAFAFQGRLFWVVVSIGIIIWDEDPFSASQNDKPAVCRLIPLPPGCGTCIATPELVSRRNIGVSGGYIQFIQMLMSGKTMLRLWRLKDTVSGEWVLLHKVRQDYLFNYLHGHLGITLPTVCFLHPLDVDTVFFQTGAYVFSYNLRTGKVVSIVKFIGNSDYIPVVLPAWPASIPPRSYATCAKEVGNDLFRSGRYEEAISSYSWSINLSASALAYANRALAYLKMSRFQEAEDDCTHALSFDNNYVKVYGRRAMARLELGDLQGSLEDIEYALKLEPNNKGLKKQHIEIKSLLEKEQASSAICKEDDGGGASLGMNN